VLLGDYDAALARAEQALAAQEGALGRSHPQVITELRLIAEIASKQGRSGFARSTVEEALRRVDSAPEGDRVRLRMKLLVQLSEIERRRDPRRAAELARQALDLPDARRHPGEHGRALLALACATAAEGGGAFEPTLGAALRELRALPDARQAELAFAEAKARALAGEQDRALEGIRKAVELGFADAELLLGEDFSALRQRPDFAPIAERVQQRLDRSG
jgi:tetratricopeptide (TPR) repeat protein